MQEHKKTVKTELIMLDNLDSASITKAGAALQGKIVMVKPGGTTIPDAFKAYATRYGDTSLDNITEKYMVTPTQMESFLPFIKNH